MLGFLFEKTTAILSETYDAAANAVDFVVEDLKSIPDSVEKGWNEGLFTHEEKSSETKVETKPESKSIFDKE